ncbi:MAG: hypothetical protein ACRD96_18870, partial [Bryobacteraceae bacterium]
MRTICAGAMVSMGIFWLVQHRAVVELRVRFENVAGDTVRSLEHRVSELQSSLRLVAASGKRSEVEVRVLGSGLVRKIEWLAAGETFADPAIQEALKRARETGTAQASALRWLDEGDAEFGLVVPAGPKDRPAGFAVGICRLGALVWA